jgi:hypothetical protein
MKFDYLHLYNLKKEPRFIISCSILYDLNSGQILLNADYINYHDENFEHLRLNDIM